MKSNGTFLINGGFILFMCEMSHKLYDLER